MQTENPGAKSQRAAPPGRSARIARLAAAFAQEPELIAACLQGGADSTPDLCLLVLEAVAYALAQHADYADLYYFGGRAALAAGDTTLARRYLREALRLNPAYNDARVLAARLALDADQPRDAREELAKALACGADYPDVHLLLGHAWAREAQWERAREAYLRALTLNANLSPARAALEALPSGDGTWGGA